MQLQLLLLLHVLLLAASHAQPLQTQDPEFHAHAHALHALSGAQSLGWQVTSSRESQRISEAGNRPPDVTAQQIQYGIQSAKRTLPQAGRRQTQERLNQIVYIGLHAHAALECEQ